MSAIVEKRLERIHHVSGQQIYIDY